MDLGLLLRLGIRTGWVTPLKAVSIGYALKLGTQKQFQSGPGRIAGLVQINGVTSSIPQKIRLYSRNTGQLIDQVISKADGTYEFLRVDTTPGREYEVVGIDGTRTYNAVIQDMVKP